MLDDRNDISGLSQKISKLAQHYQSLIAEVNSPLNIVGYDASRNTKATRRREATRELEACLEDIRAIPGHERFLLGQTVGEMQEGMSESYVVIVNISTIGSYAIVITQNSLQAISVPELSVVDARRWLSID